MNGPRLAALAALALTLALPAGAGPLDALPAAPLPADHPARVPEASFVPLNARDGVTIRIAEMPDGVTLVRSEVDVPSPPEEAAAVLADVARWPEWLRRVKRTEPVAGAPNAWHVFIHAPWPFRDRDYGLALSRDDGSPERVAVWWESASDRIGPPSPGHVRVARIRGAFVLTPVPGGSHVVYTDVADLGGRLPRWALRESYKRGPIGVLASFRRRVAPLSAR